MNYSKGVGAWWECFALFGNRLPAAIFPGQHRDARGSQFPQLYRTICLWFSWKIPPLLGAGCQDGAGALAGLWHTWNQNLGCFQAVCEQAQRAACRSVHSQGCFRWLPSPQPWSSPLPLPWQLRGSCCTCSPRWVC